MRIYLLSLYPIYQFLILPASSTFEQNWVLPFSNGEVELLHNSSMPIPWDRQRGLITFPSHQQTLPHLTYSSEVYWRNVYLISWASLVPQEKRNTSVVFNITSNNPCDISKNSKSTLL